MAISGVPRAGQTGELAISAALAAGADAFVPKGAPVAELIAALSADGRVV